MLHFTSLRSGRTGQGKNSTENYHFLHLFLSVSRVWSSLNFITIFSSSLLRCTRGLIHKREVQFIAIRLSPLISSFTCIICMLCAHSCLSAFPQKKILYTTETMALHDSIETQRMIKKLLRGFPSWVAQRIFIEEICEIVTSRLVDSAVIFHKQCSV